MTTIAVVSAGLSEPSSSRLLADRLADATVSALAGPSLQSETSGAFRTSADGTHRTGGPTRVVHVDLRPLAHEITDTMLTRFAPAALGAAIAEVVESDAVVFVAPVFTAGMSGLAKSFLDVLEPDALVDMPVLLGATGGSARHSLAVDHGMRPVFAYLRAAVAQTAVFAATDDWGSAEHAAGLESRIRRAGEDLAHGVRTSRRRAVSAPDASPTVTDFGSLLDALGT
ncbi:CE1759 family FMN reductase [Curtobacterium sp. Leaf261]|uniref:CE1759 family FMN reductase n=1 Tax=Curtobacterium sp. Leaf261 TaxID=1736311 RepID=UPI0006F7294C|nr:CE1759 family FMN reductase [Curtobacterium sp. Leaf261]KQO63071.1 NADPH-dependent FMN reductase [Curtobacterium sp. Leaf261]